jgi:hypothetical protein
MLSTKDTVIHRSRHTVILKETPEEAKKRMIREERKEEIKRWNWHSNKPILPFQRFDNIVPVIEGVK